MKQPAHIWALIQRLWKRFYGSDATNAMFREMKDYLNGRGEYGDFHQWCERTRSEAQEEVSQ